MKLTSPPWASGPRLGGLEAELDVRGAEQARDYERRGPLGGGLRGRASISHTVGPKVASRPKILTANLPINCLNLAQLLRAPAVASQKAAKLACSSRANSNRS